MFDVNDNAKVGFRRVEVLTGPDGVGAGRRERRHRLLLRRSRQAHGYQKWLAAGRSVHSRCLAGVERGEPAFVPIIMESGSRDKTCEVRSNCWYGGTCGVRREHCAAERSVV